MSLMMQAMMAASRRRVTLDPDALDYFSRAEALGGSFDQTAIDPTYGEAYVKGAISDMIAGLKADTVWSKITELYLLTGVSFGGLMAKVKHAGTAVLTNTNFVSGDYLAAGSGAGLKGNGSNKFLNSNFSDSSLDPDDNSFLAYITEKAVGLNFPTYLGVRNNISPEVYKILYFNHTTDRFQMQFPLSASVTTSHQNSFIIASRRGVNDFQGYKNGSSIGVDLSTPASVPFALNHYIYGYNQNGNAGAFSNARMSQVAIGSGLTSTEATNLSLRINALMTALGCNVYNNP